MTFVKRAFLFMASTLLLASSASAQLQGRPEERLRYLENRVSQLEYSLSQINQRLAILESNQRPQPYPGGPSREVSCMIVDTLIGKPSLSKGRTRMEAEANVREACGKNVHSSYCQANVKCSDERDLSVRQGVLCILKDTLLSKTYKGEGKSFIEAEFQVRKACADNVHGSYCKAEAQCEAF